MSLHHFFCVRTLILQDFMDGEDWLLYGYAMACTYNSQRHKGPVRMRWPRLLSNTQGYTKASP